jgi:hypothetical protein
VRRLGRISITISIGRNGRDRGLVVWPGCLEYQTCTATFDDDIDRHRFRRRQCGRTTYYSGTARAFHEEGIKSCGIQGAEQAALAQRAPAR